MLIFFSITWSNFVIYVNILLKLTNYRSCFYCHHEVDSLYKLLLLPSLGDVEGWEKDIFLSILHTPIRINVIMIMVNNIHTVAHDHHRLRVNTSLAPSFRRWFIFRRIFIHPHKNLVWLKHRDKVTHMSRTYKDFIHQYVP